MVRGRPEQSSGHVGVAPVLHIHALLLHSPGMESGESYRRHAQPGIDRAQALAITGAASDPDGSQAAELQE